MSKSSYPSLNLIKVEKFNPETTSDSIDLLEGKTAKEWLTNIYSRGPTAFGIDELKRNNYFKYLGYKYSFNMPCFVYRQKDGWHEAYAPNKTLLRKAVFGVIDKILVLEDD